MFVFIDLFMRVGYLGVVLWVGPYYILTRGNALPAKLALIANGITAFYALCLGLLCIAAVFQVHKTDLPHLLLFHFLPPSMIVLLAFLFRRKPAHVLLPLCLLLNFPAIYTSIVSLFRNPETFFVPMGDSDLLIEDFFRETPYTLPLIAVPFEILLWTAYALSWWVEKVSGNKNFTQTDAP